MDRTQKDKGKGKSKNVSTTLASTPISIKSTSTTRTHPVAPLTPPSLMSPSMRSSFKHEVFDFGGPSSSSIPIIVSTSCQGFQWNRDVFLKDEYFYYANQQNRQQSFDERIVAHEIHLDEEDELMFA